MDNHGFKFCVAVRDNMFVPWKRLCILDTKIEAQKFSDSIKNSYNEIVIFPY